MHRLRDLDARGRVLALVVVLALAAPFVGSVAKAMSIDWTPTNDEALIAVRVHEVLGGDLPLVGQPSTADAYSSEDPPRHPGPIEYYLLAPPVALLGFDVGMLVGAGIFNLAAVLIAVWVAFRRGGPGVGLGAAVVVSAIGWSEGLAVLTDPISSNVGGIPLLALAALAWALLDGDLRLVPLAALVFAFVCQQHLAVVTLSLGTGAWAAVGIALAVVASIRARRPEGHDAGGDAPSREPEVGRVWPWLVGGLAVTVVAWLPVVVDQFWGDGNLSRMARFASSSERPTLGPRAGVVQALRALGLPPLITRTDLDGHDLTARLSVAAAVGALLVAAALVAIVVRRWRTCRSHATLAATTLVLAVIGAVNGANVPDSVEAGRLNFYRWTFVVSVGVCLSLGWAVAAGLEARRPQLAARLVAPSRVAAVVVVVAVAVASITVGGPQARRDQEIFDVSHRLGAAAVRAVDGEHRVLLLLSGTSATLSVGPAVALDLIEAGHDVLIVEQLESGWGGDRVFRPGDHADAVLMVASDKTEVDGALPGVVLARADLKAELRPVIAALADQVRGKEVVPAPDAQDVVRREIGRTDTPRAELLQYAISTLGEDPEAVLQIGDAVRLIRAGYLAAPVLDPDLLSELDESGNTLNWGDDVLELRSLSLPEALAHADLGVGT